MRPTVVLALAAPLVQAWPHPQSCDKALYFLDSDPDGASIVSLNVANDGSVSNPVKVSTGGKGMIGKSADGFVSADPLFSQGAVATGGNRLFTVNAGSNTLSSFWIPSHDAQNPVLSSQPVDTGGDFPNSVAYSEKWKIACVTNTGTRAGLQCFSVSDCGAVNPMGGLKSLPVNQTVPPVGPPNTVSDVAFNPSESAVFVIIKGNGMDPGYIYVFPVKDGKVGDKPVVSRPKELLIDFSINFLSEKTALVTDASYGGSIVDVADDWSVTVSHMVNVTGQSATCWGAYSKKHDVAFLLDTGTPNITSIDPQSGDVKYVVAGKAEGMGNFDGVVLDDWLYTLQGSTAVTVYSLNGRVPKVMQYIDLSRLGDRAGLTGMAAWSKSG